MPRRKPPSLVRPFVRQAGRQIKPRARSGRKPVAARKVRAVAKKAEPKIARAITGAIEATRQQTSRRQIEAALERKQIEQAIEVIPWERVGAPRLRATHGVAYREVFEAGASTAADRIGLDFAVLNPAAAAYLSAHGGEFVTTLAGMTRTDLRETLVDMLNRGRSVQQVAADLKARIGLTPRLSAAVDNLRERLTDRGLNEARINKAVARKTEELLRYRARLIAQTEAQNAATAGQQQAWAQAKEEGLIDDTFLQEWVTSSDPCPEICAPMEGQQRRLGEMFVTGDGRQIVGPGGAAHPNCLCVLVGVPGERQAAA